jgi:hypothetical protein
MKPATGTLATFLVNANSLVYVDLYTVTLNGGAIYRWCSGDVSVGYGGNTFTVPMTSAFESISVMGDRFRARMSCGRERLCYGVLTSRRHS